MKVVNNTKKVAIEKVAEAKNKMQEMREVFYAQCNDLLKECYKEIFSGCPTLVGFQWEHWVPAFNDGEACEFTSNFGEFDKVLCVIDPSDLYKLTEKDYNDLSSIDFEGNSDFDEYCSLEFCDEVNPEYEEGDSGYLKNRAFIKTSDGVKLYDPRVLVSTGSRWDFGAYSENFPVLKDFFEAFNDYDLLENMFGSNVRITVLRNGTVNIDEYDCGY